MSETPTPATGGQRSAVALLAEFVAAFPDLPAPSIVVHAHSELGLALQLMRGCDVEAWRQALGIDPALMRLSLYVNVAWLETAVQVGPVLVQLHGDVPLPPDRAARTPLEDAAFQAAMLVQRHELEDPAEPPLPGAQPVELVEVRTLADMPGGAA